jgi:acyl dehydratase
MSWMEQCAYISASRLRGSHLLTAGMDSVTFAAPTKVGDILYITAQVRPRQLYNLCMLSSGCHAPWFLMGLGAVLEIA